MEEVAFELAGAAVGSPAARGRGPSPVQHHGRMTEVLRYMAEHAAAPHKLAGLARMARMSPYHFLRSFKAVTGVTPHQWLLRARLREAAERLATTQHAGDRYRARRRVRRSVEFHPHVPRRIRRLAAGISAGGVTHARSRRTGSSPDMARKRNFLQVFRAAALLPVSHQTNGDSHAQSRIDRRARHRAHQALLRRGAEAARLQRP